MSKPAFSAALRSFVSGVGVFSTVLRADKLAAEFGRIGPQNRSRILNRIQQWTGDHSESLTSAA